MSDGRATYRRRELSIKWVVREVIRPTPAYGASDPVRNPADTFAYLVPWCREPQETVVVLFLNARMRVMGHRQISCGGVASTAVSIRSLMQSVLLSGAAAFIIAHNHPSGDPTPSSEDLEMTAKVKRLAAELEVPLLDHLILACTADGSDIFVSLKETGAL